MLAQFQSLYPNGSIISELVEIFQGKYIVRVSIQIDGVTRATGMAAAETVEAAEDSARNRALMVLGIGNTPVAAPLSAKPEPSVTQVSPTVKTADTVPKSADLAATTEETISNQLTAVSNQELSVPTPNDFSIQPEPIVTEPTPQIPELPSISHKDTYSQDYPQQFALNFHPDSQNPNTYVEQQTEYQPSVGITASNVTPFTPRNYSSSEDVDPPTTSRKKKKIAPIDLSDVIAKTDVELQRLGWTPEQGREYLIKTYGKRGRTLLTEEELQGFLKYLESQPTPIDPLTGF